MLRERAMAAATFCCPSWSWALFVIATQPQWRLLYYNKKATDLERPSDLQGHIVAGKWSTDSKRGASYFKVQDACTMQRREQARWVSHWTDRETEAKNGNAEWEVIHPRSSIWNKWLSCLSPKGAFETPSK
jgi:hypothetical protein